MRRILSSLMVPLLMLSAMGLVSSPASAEQATIPSMETLAVPLTMSADSTISYSWTSDLVLQFSIRDQAMNVLRTASGTTGAGLYTVDSGGVYTLVWTNLYMEAAEIDYDFEVIDIGAGFLDDIGDTIIGGLIIILVVVIVIVAVVVVVVAQVGRKKPKAVTGPGAGVVPPMGNNCAVCGSPITPSTSFCAKCGAKLR